MPADRVGGRRAVLVGFAAFGGFWGSWGAVVPAVQRRAGVDDAELGLALLLIGAGALASMRMTGCLVDRFGARVLPLAVGALAAAASLPALAGSAAALSAALLVVGAASGATDVALNTAGAAWEARGGAPLLNLAHAAFSLAVVGASLSAGLLRHAGVGPVGILGLDAVALAGCAVAVRPRVRSAVRRPPGRGTPARRPPEPPGTAGRRVTRRLLVLGLLCALAYWVESAWQNWGAVLLENALGAAAGVSALAPALFALAAAAGRLGGQRLTRRFADRTVLRAGALTATAGTA
ncbi:MAG TPA: MFS transporter, partial [Frankiaceae bacterium]|nr:MFS transporter [Frankiaceae bacterium]